MKKHLLFALLCLLVTSNSFSQSVAQTRCNSLHKGVNLSNWLEGYWEINWPDTADYTRQFFVEMKAAGIESIRMPVCFALVTDTAYPYNVDTTNRVFKIIDSVISWTTQLNLNLIIDNHHQWSIFDSTWQQQTPRLAHLWSVLAQRYSYLDPNHYYFEILNEPYNIANDSLPFVYNPIIDTIRKYAPNHSIIGSATSYSNGFGYFGFKPFADTNIIYTFHSYDPFQFTHQGLSFVQPPLPIGVPFPNSGYDDFINLDWTIALNWRDTFQLPLFLGEFGVGIGADANSRCNWMDTITHLIRANNLSAFYWDVVGDFKWYNSGVATRDSIIPCFSHAFGLYGDTLTAINNISTTNTLNLYPNPAQDLIVISIPDNLSAGAFNIINTIGATVKSGYLQSGNNRLEVNTLSNGIYFMEANVNGQRVNRKFVINK